MCIRDRAYAVRYDGLENKCYALKRNAEGNAVLSLEPGEAAVCLFLREEIPAEIQEQWEESERIEGTWEIYAADSRAKEPVLIKSGDSGVLEDLNPWLAAEKFNGQIIYLSLIHI